MIPGERIPLKEYVSNILMKKSMDKEEDVTSPLLTIEISEILVPAPETKVEEPPENKVMNDSSIEEDATVEDYKSLEMNEKTEGETIVEESVLPNQDNLDEQTVIEQPVVTMKILIESPVEPAPSLDELSGQEISEKLVAIDEGILLESI